MGVHIKPPGSHSLVERIVLPGKIETRPYYMSIPSDTLRREQAPDYAIILPDDSLYAYDAHHERNIPAAKLLQSMLVPYKHFKDFEVIPFSTEKYTGFLVPLERLEAVLEVLERLEQYSITLKYPKLYAKTKEGSQLEIGTIKRAGIDPDFKESVLAEQENIATLRAEHQRRQSMSL